MTGPVVYFPYKLQRKGKGQKAMGQGRKRVTGIYPFIFLTSLNTVK
jgi:hypothetical protein